MKKFQNIIMIVVVVALALTACQGQGKSQYDTVAAAKGSLSAKVGATGTVRSNQSAQLLWQTTGTVDTVNVKVGDKVKTDDVLATLRLDSMPAAIVSGPSDLATAQRDLQDMLDSTTSLAQAQLNVVNAQKALETALNNWNGLDYPRASDTLIKSTQAQIWEAQDKLTLATKAYRQVQNRPDGDSLKAAALLAMTNAQMALNNLQELYNWYTGKPTQYDYEKTKATLDLARAALDDAKQIRDNVKNGVDPLKIAAAQSRIAAAQSTLNLSRVTAPFNATVTDAKLLPGDQVAPGLVAFRLDDLSSLLVDVDISEIDINSIQIGQTADISFDAILGNTYKGVVTKVSTVGVVVQGAVNFTVTLKLTNADGTVKPGMTAAVNILVKQLDNVLLVPNRAVRVVNGSRVVYVLRNGAPAQVKIQLGATSDNDSEVVGGDLKVGDLIILNPPAVFGPSSGGPASSGGGGG
ncbi:MAG: efflux RND transporter periplasmic adaptor subunit [Anaerolineales bacterium]